MRRPAPGSRPDTDDQLMLHARGQRSTLNRLYKPARCKLGRHILGHSQFRAVVHDGEAHISCLACATDTPDHFWRLTATAPAPDRAELSEELYLDLVQSRSRAALSSKDRQHD